MINDQIKSTLKAKTTLVAAVFSGLAFTFAS
jgi:hypothetical protein